MACRVGFAGIDDTERDQSSGDEARNSNSDFTKG